MSLTDDLLAQAQHLATLDRGRPKQANLRRAASTAYYALFHLLIADAAQRMTPRTDIPLAPRVARSITHTDMRDVCRQVYAGGPSPVLRLLLPTPFSATLRSVAGTFMILQDARLRADYDITSRLTRSETAGLLSATEEAFNAWKRIRKSDESTLFLAALLFAKRWDR